MSELTKVSGGAGILFTGPGVLEWIVTLGAATVRDGGASGTIILKMPANQTHSAITVPFKVDLYVDVVDVTVGVSSYSG